MDLPAKDVGIGGHANSTLVQLFAGADSKFTSIYPINAKSEFPHALQDFIRSHSAMKSLHSNNAKEETSTLVAATHRSVAVFVIRNGIDIPLWSTRLEQEERDDEKQRTIE